MNKLLQDIAWFDKRVFDLTEEGFDLRQAEHIAEKELFLRFMSKRGALNI